MQSSSAEEATTTGTDTISSAEMFRKEIALVEAMSSTRLEKLSASLLKQTPFELVLGYLVLILSCIRHVGLQPERRSEFAELLSVFYEIVHANRAIKMNFLLLLQNREFNGYWRARLIYHNDPYPEHGERKVSISEAVDATSPSAEISSFMERMRTAYATSEVLEPVVTDVFEPALDTISSDISEKSESAKSDPETHKSAVDFEELESRSLPVTRSVSHSGGLKKRSSMNIVKEVHALTKKGSDKLLSVPKRREGRGSSERGSSETNDDDWVVVAEEDKLKEKYQQEVEKHVHPDERKRKTRKADRGKPDDVEVVRIAAAVEPVASVKLNIYLDDDDLQSLHVMGDFILVLPCHIANRHAAPYAVLQNQSLTEGATLGYFRLAHPYDLTHDSQRVTKLRVEHIFTSIARPTVLSFRQTAIGAVVSSESSWIEPTGRIIVKKGDNLMTDLGVQVMFRVMTALWKISYLGLGSECAASAAIAEHLETMYSGSGFEAAAKGPFETLWKASSRRKLVPRADSFQVVPCGHHVGFLEYVADSKPLKGYDWKTWAKTASPTDMETFVCSAAGSYVAGYILSVRDRHFDNFLVARNRSLVQLDFNYILGDAPPADGPPFSVQQDMKNMLVEIGLWELFLDLAASAWVVMRLRGREVSRLTCLTFSQTLGWRKEVISDLLKNPLKIHQPITEAHRRIRSDLDKSAELWKTWWKNLTHSAIDPVLYALVKRDFTPMNMILASVEGKQAKRSKKLQEKAPDGIAARVDKT